MLPSSLPRLYHYTCDHGQENILADQGWLRPAVAVAAPRIKAQLLRIPVIGLLSQLVWLTSQDDLTWLNAGRAGLNMAEIARITGEKPCNRTAFRWEVTDTEHLIVPWTELRERWPIKYVVALEMTPGAQPQTWFVSRGPLQARYSPNRAVA